MSALPALPEQVPSISSESDRITSREIANVLRLSFSQIKRNAANGAWPFVEKTLAGGGKVRLYLVSDLPADIRARILAHRLRETTPVAPPPPRATGLADWQAKARDARLALLAEVGRQAELCGVAWTTAAKSLVEAAREGALTETTMRLIATANQRGGKTGSRTLSLRSLERWDADRRKEGVAGPAPRASKAPVPPPVWLEPLLKLYRQPQPRSLPALLEDLAEVLPPGVAVPPLTTARNWLAKVAPQVREKGRLGPRAMLALKACRRRDTTCLEPLDVVVADGHTFRAKIQHPVHGQPFQPEVMVVIDVATRYGCGWSAGLAESTHVVMDGLRHAVLSCGLPAILYTDNGSGFVNEATSDELLGFYARLGVLHEKAEPGRAQARGLIERRQASLWRRAAKKLPTYCGRDMDREASRKVTKLVEKDIKAAGTSRLLPTWSDFLAWCQNEIDAYNNRPQRCLPKIRDPETGVPRHMSPAEALQAWRVKGWQPLTIRPEEAEDLWRPYEIRTTNRGEVQLPWGRYFSAELEPWHGDKVRVGYDIHDGSKVWVRTLADGRLICIANRDGNLTPYMPATKVEHARAVRAAGRERLLQGHLAEVRAEAGPLPIDATVSEITLTPDQIAAADATIARLTGPAPAITPPVAATGRPIFANDAAWASWLIANPDAVTPRDRVLIADVIKNPAAKALLGATGVDLAALRALAVTPISTPIPEDHHA